MRSLILVIISLTTISLGCKAKSGAEIIHENGFKAEVAPMLTTEWCQDGGENALLPIVDGEHVLTGCGVTATAQVMKYWASPATGQGANYYIWDYLLSGREVLHADFASTNYEWDRMINRYKENPSATPAEINAVAVLMRDLGVALQVKYESSSTATNIEYISTILKKYFGYNPNMTIHRYVNGAYTMDEWLTIIYGELSAGRPVIMGGNCYGANHIYVADGYDRSGKVHLNLGKANKGGSLNTNGYFDLTLTGETYTSEMRMLTGIAPYSIDSTPEIFNVAEAGTLKDVLGGDIMSRKICRIKLLGNLNATDFAWLQKLSAITTGQLSYIDMSEANVEGNMIPEGAFTDSYTLQEIILPASVKKIGARAFRNTNGLWKVTLPDALEEIGDYAFSACRYLESLSFPATLSKIGSNPMRYVHLSTMDLSNDNTHFTISNGALCNKKKDILYAMPMVTMEEYTVEDGIRTISIHAFSMQSMIPAVHLPESVRNIGKWAFYECLGLKDLYISASTPPEYGQDAFSRETLSECVVHIPVGSMFSYLNSKWSEFENIVEDENVNSVHAVDSPDRSLTGIYDLNGCRIEKPIHGQIYIMHFSDGSVKKAVY